jgi:hypothetical protein
MIDPERRTVRSRSLMRLCIAALWSALLLLFTGSPTRAFAQDFTVTAQSSQNYTINGLLDPPLTLLRGRTYTFAVNAPDHPFFIKTLPGAGTGNQYNEGVTNNGLTSGTLTFNVPLNAPDPLFYQCSDHAAMNAEIDVRNPPAAVPAYGPGAIGLLGLLLVFFVSRSARARSYA